RAESSFDPKTGEISLRCLNGLVNNFNSAMIEAIYCAMDINFIGSSVSAKGIVYYIAHYITKSQLKTHVAFSMLELALDMLILSRQKDASEVCFCHDILARLSSQQVASYLMDFEDHFTSHSYQTLYW
ncbi:hypothetical protein B0H14DRAFT_2293224, partial [Mycena olivaceomarginata]